MRKLNYFVLISLLATALIGCSSVNTNKNTNNNINGVSSSNQSNLDQNFKIKDKIELANNKMVYFKENDLGESMITLKSAENEMVALVREYPSNPVVSPDKQKMAYISPHSWEVIGELFVYDSLADKSNLVLARETLPSEWTVKKLAWIDNNHLLAIIGYAYGTVSLGGDLFLIDVNSKKQYLLIKNPTSRQEIIDMTIRDQSVKLSIANFTKKMDSYDLTYKVLSKEEILATARNY